MENDVILDNLPQTSNLLLNILWDRNKAMTLDEMTEVLKAEYEVDMDRKRVSEFVRVLVFGDYVNKRRKGFHVYYSALGMEDVPEDLL